MKNNIKIIFIHGNGGSTVHDGWFLWLGKELEKHGVTVVAWDFPDAVLARASYWLPFLENELEADENSILVGHSSGAIAAMRYAETHKVYGSVLVAGYTTDLGDAGEKASGYFDAPWDWDSIKRNQNWIVQYSSTDDPYIPVEESRALHEKLDTEYYEYPDQGHFGGEVKKMDFPELRDLLLKKIS